MLLDPGGAEIFPAVFSALSAEFDPSALTAIFASPGSRYLLVPCPVAQFNPGLRCYVSWLWESFIPHFGGNAQTFVALPDAGQEIPLAGLPLRRFRPYVPAFFGQFQPLRQDGQDSFLRRHRRRPATPAKTGSTSDFASHIGHAEGFHRRWMGSNEAKRRWCERVSRLEIEQLCPQHGAIYRGADVQRFINWFDELPVGIVND